MSDIRDQYLEWLLSGQKGARPGGMQSKLGVPVGEPVNPDAGLPAVMGPRDLAPMGPRTLVPAAAGGAAAEAAGTAPWLSMLPAAAAALYSQDVNPGEQDMIDKILGQGAADPERKQNIFDRVSDAYARNAGSVGDAPKVVAAKKQAPTPKTMEAAKPTTPQVGSIEDLRVLKRLQERAALQSDMGLDPASEPERQQEMASPRKKSGSMDSRVDDRLQMRNSLK